MNVHTIIVGEFEVNCYLYWEQDSKEGVIIDPGANSSTIINEIEELGITPIAILLTHGHSDHIGAVTKLKDQYAIPLYAGKGEEELLSSPTANLSAMLGLDIKAPPAEQWLVDEQVLSVGPVELRVLATPGHSPGGICYLDEKHNNLFCGDTLFYGSVGRTDFPGCSHQQLITSIETKLLTLPDGIICYPGHGPQTTIGGERTNNPFLQGDYLA